MKFNLTRKFIDQLSALIKEDKPNKVLGLVRDLHCADIAEIFEEIEFRQSAYIYNLLDDDLGADVLVELDNDIRESLLKTLSPKEIAEDVIENLESDDAADIVSDLPQEKKEEVLSHIEDISHASDIADLLKYTEDSAGGLMAKEFISVKTNWSITQCIKEMRKQAEEVKFVYTIYVVDENNILKGTLSLKKLLFSNAKTIMSDIMKSDIIMINANKDQEDVANIMNKYDLVALPVVNELGQLIGRITADDVMDIMKEEAEKDYQMASGISDDVESNDSIIEITKARLPWLLIGLIGGLIGAKVIGIFDIEKNYEMAFFIPLIAAMGGNVGVQSAAIVVQGLAGGSVSIVSIWNRLIKELGVAMVNGLICSLIILIATYTLGYDMAMSITVSVSLFAVIIFAALFGTFVPLTLEKYNIDPALATGPFITTVNDVLGLFIYFLIGQMILGL
jgi:magnesium transporter